MDPRELLIKLLVAHGTENLLRIDDDSLVKLVNRLHDIAITVLDEVDPNCDMDSLSGIEGEIKSLNQSIRQANDLAIND